MVFGGKKIALNERWDYKVVEFNQIFMGDLERKSDDEGNSDEISEDPSQVSPDNGIVNNQVAEVRDQFRWHEVVYPAGC